MKNIISLGIVALLLTQISIAQMTMHNFSVTDTHGKTHNLYNDYLAQGKVVVVKFFFTTCPPCIANAPYWQQKYVELGSGLQKVEFFSVTTILSDNNLDVASFEQAYNQTMKGIGNDGNARQIVEPFLSGTYGSWWGTPSFAVIGPDKKLTYPVFFNELDEAIKNAETVTTVVPTAVNLQLVSNNFDVPEDHIKFFLQSKSGSAPRVEILKNNDGKYSFSYPSAAFPQISDPEVIMESIGPAYTYNVSASDILAIQKHILGIESLNAPYKILAADVNSDGIITASDLLNMKKVILGLSDSFPNGTPSYKAIPEKINLSPAPGTTVPLDFIIVKMGNVN